MILIIYKPSGWSDKLSAAYNSLLNVVFFNTKKEILNRIADISANADVYDYDRSSYEYYIIEDADSENIGVIMRDGYSKQYYGLNSEDNLFISTKKKALIEEIQKRNAGIARRKEAMENKKKEKEELKLLAELKAKYSIKELLKRGFK